MILSSYVNLDASYGNNFNEYLQNTRGNEALKDDSDYLSSLNVDKKKGQKREEGGSKNRASLSRPWGWVY